MTDIINLRRVRKAKAKAQKDKTAEANRVFFGRPKSLRNLTRARTEKEGQTLSDHRLEDRDDQN